MSKVIAFSFSVIFSFGLLSNHNAFALEILLSDNGSDALDVGSRLTGLGHNVIESDASTWDASFDYSPYDVVVFQFNSSNPADVPNFLSAVDSGDVGVVFFRGYGAETTAVALGLITGPELWYQQPADLNIIDNSHPITSGLAIGVQNLGYTYMTLVELPGPDTTLLGTGPDGGALLVHNSRAAVISPFYAHPDNYDLETANAIQITENSLQWAASAIVNPSYFNVVATVAAGNGSVSCDPASVAPGSSSTCTADPDAGWQVSSWTGACAAAGTSDTCTLDNIQADQSSTVSFEAIPGSITVTKIATPATLPSGNVPAFLFTGDAAGGVGAGASLVVDNLAPGSYTSTEVVPAGWELVEISCDDASSVTPSVGDLASATATFNVDPGEDVTCTFTNHKFASLNVIKHVVNDDGGTATVNDFGIATSAGQIFWDAPVTNGDTTTYTGLVEDISASQGPFTLSETDLDGYTEGNWVCEGADAGAFDTASVVLAPGDEKTCEITNDDDAAAPPPATVEAVPVPVDNHWLLAALALLILAAGVVGIRRVG